MIIIDKSKGFLPYASFLKRPIPSIHGKHLFGTISCIPEKTQKKSEIAISLKESVDGKSFFFDAPFGEIDYVDRTADYLRYKFLESLSITIGITHVKRKSKPTTSSSPDLHANSLLLENRTENDLDALLYQLSQKARRTWEDKVSRTVSREEIFKLSSTVREPPAAKKYSIHQPPKSLHGPLLCASIAANAMPDRLPNTNNDLEATATSTSCPSSAETLNSTQSSLQTDNSKLRVRGKIVGFSSGAQGYAVSVAGWIAYLPCSQAFLQQLQAELTPTSFLSKFLNVPLDCLYVKSCLLDTDSGTPLITLSIDISEVSKMLQHEHATMTSQETAI